MSPVHRFFTPGDHFYTSDENEKNKVLNVLNFDYEGIEFYAFPTQVSGTIPVYRILYVGFDHIYTTSLEEKNNLIDATMDGSSNYLYEGIIGYVYSAAKEKTKAIYRLYNPEWVDHFYTTNEAEKNGAINSVGFTDEGVIGYAYTTLKDGIKCKQNSDCGPNGYKRKNYCSGNDVYRTYRSFTCNNKGTLSSSCSWQDQEILQTSCSTCVDGACR